MDLNVKQKYESYPDNARVLFTKIRNLIFEVAQRDGVGNIEETLKWGEPSYLTKGGSTIRLDWKSKSPNQFFIYFNCKTSLVETFKELFGNLFNYEGNRAILLNISDEIPLELKICISLSLRYHKIKALPLLGM